MKKILLTLLCAVCASFSAMADTYTDKLIVTINEESTDPQDATVDLTLNDDNTFNFSLKNFVLWNEGAPMPVGNINLKNIPLETGDSYNTFSAEQEIMIQPGDEGFSLVVEGEEFPLAEEDWVGPFLPLIPIKLVGKMTAEKLYVSIDIDLSEVLEQIIYVSFGDEEFPVNGITAIEAEQGSVRTFDLQGRSLRAAHNGIAIMNSKKVIR